MDGNRFRIPTSDGTLNPLFPFASFPHCGCRGINNLAVVGRRWIRREEVVKKALESHTPSSWALSFGKDKRSPGPDTLIPRWSGSPQ